MHDYIYNLQIQHQCNSKYIYKNVYTHVLRYRPPINVYANKRSRSRPTVARNKNK